MFEKIVLSAADAGKDEEQQQLEVPLLQQRSNIGIRQRSQENTLIYYFVLICCSLVIAFVGFWAVSPQPCMQVKECAALHNGSSNEWVSQWIAAGMVTLLIRELVGLVLIHVEEQDSSMRQLGVPRARTSHVLLCVCLLVLAVVEVTGASGPSWQYAVPPVYGFRNAWGSVQTLRFCGWLLSVPALLLLSGHILLGRPFNEVLVPAAITNAYMTLSWMALMVETPFMRWALMTVTWGFYFWATYNTLFWAKSYWQMAPPQLPGRYARVSLLAWLNMLFFIHGLIYLFDVFGLISTKRGHDLYGIFDSFAKLVTCFCLAHCRSSERVHAMGLLIAVHSRMNRASLSVLRSSFDYLLPCKLDEQGNCYVLDVCGSDVRAIEQLTGKALAGQKFTDILAAPRDRDLFDAHVQTGLQQEDDDLAAEVQLRQQTVSESKSFWNSHSWLAPVSVAPVFNYDVQCTLADASGRGNLSVIIHLSSAVGISTQSDTAPQMIIALRVAQESMCIPDSMPPVTEMTEMSDLGNSRCSLSGASPRLRRRNDSKAGSTSGTEDMPLQGPRFQPTQESIFDLSSSSSGFPRNRGTPSLSDVHPSHYSEANVDSASMSSRLPKGLVESGTQTVTVVTMERSTETSSDCSDAAVQTNAVRPPRQPGLRDEIQHSAVLRRRVPKQLRIPKRVNLCSSRRILPEFDTTPDNSIMTLLSIALDRVNTTGTGCCALHISVTRQRKVLDDIMIQACQKDFKPFDTWQCARCFCMGDAEEKAPGATTVECPVCSCTTDCLLPRDISDEANYAGSSSITSE